MIKMHAAQYLSFLRLFLAPCCIVYLTDIPYRTEIFLVIVFVAGVSDFLDGYIARTQGTTSYFGAVLDFTADKLFVLSALVVMSIDGILPYWITLVILYREVMVMGLRIFASHHHLEIPSSMAGKIKTWITFFAIGGLGAGIPYSHLLFYLAVFLTLVSFFLYLNGFVKARKEMLAKEASRS